MGFLYIKSLIAVWCLHDVLIVHNLESGRISIDSYHNIKRICYTQGAHIQKHMNRDCDKLENAGVEILFSCGENP